MNKYSKKYFYIGASEFAAFVLWTILVRFVDVKTIGPGESAVGFSTVNSLFHKLTGVNMTLYTITDWLGFIPIFFAMGFACLGLIQWSKRKSILNVDFSILTLGGFYIATIAAYLFFEAFVINYRPVFINGYLEASYPSSTTMLVLCIIPTAIIQFHRRIKVRLIKQGIALSLTAFTVFMVIGRLVSGVHWLSDIIGGVLLSAGLVTIYYAVIHLK